MQAPQPSASTTTASLRRRSALGALVFIAVGACGAWGWRQFDAKPSSQELPLDDVCIDAPSVPYDPASGLALTDARPVPAQARCPVCGMYPARAPQWAAQLIFTDGAAHFFDSPLSLFLFLQDVARYSPARTSQDIARMYVSDSAQPDAGRWLEATSAWYVHGSDAKGPMRTGNLPAWSTQAAAADFARRRGGVVLTFAQIDARVLASLGPLNRHEH